MSRGRDHREWDEDEPPTEREWSEWDWQRPKGIFVLIPIDGAAGESLRAMRRRVDPKLAAMNDPHISLVGSSGVGPIDPNTPREKLRDIFEKLAASTAPFSVQAGRAHRFMQSNVVSFTLSPYGPLRELHEQVTRSGLSFLPVRFAFAPHATVNFFPTMTRERERELTALRLDEPIEIRRLELSMTNDPQRPEILLAVDLHGPAKGAGTDATPSARGE
jgi:2'-5' RNA ligase